VWPKSRRIKYFVRFLFLERIPLVDRQMQFAGWSHWERQAGDHYNCQPVGFLWCGTITSPDSRWGDERMKECGINEKNKVLVVEDNTAVAMMMTYLLSQAAFEVETAITGQRGMELATARKFDIILLDVDLPDISGFDICRELKQRHISYRTPIILLSGNGTEERRAKAFELGATDFIEKPFGGAEFVTRIQSFLGEAQVA
jgi:CheY-like chemotaxis protein